VYEGLANPDAVREQLARVLSSASFQRAERSSSFLRFLVETVLEGRSDHLKEYTIGAEALGRGDAFDPRTDPIVRAEASRLRARLERYYEVEGRGDPMVISLPKGGYVPQFAPQPRTGRTAAQSSGGRVGTKRYGWIAVTGLLSGCLLAAIAYMRVAGSNAEERFQQFDVELKSEGILGSEVSTDMALSADGNRMVFVSRDAGGIAHLNVRRLNEGRATRLAGTEGARCPFLSPDGTWAGFFADGKLEKTSVVGGSPVVLMDATDVLGASWAENGDIIASLHPTGRLWRIPQSGSAPQAILDLRPMLPGPVWPQVVAGGRYVIYTVFGAEGPDRGSIEVLSLADHTRRVLVRGGTFGRYLPGYLTYINQATLYAVPFDPSRGAITGTAVPVLDDVSYSATFGYAQMDVSATGTLVYRKSPANGRFLIKWIDRAGQSSDLIPKPARYEWLRLSPDGKRLAFSVIESGVRSVWLREMERGEDTRLGVNDWFSMLWSLDGRALVLGSTHGMASIHADRRGDNLETPHPLNSSKNIQVPWSFSPDGKWLAYYELGPSTGFDLWIAPVEPGGSDFRLGTPQPYLQTQAFEVYPSFSPDGRWMAYTSNESGTWETYVRKFPDDGTKVRVSESGGSIPRWSPNGRELLYRTDDQRIHVVSYRVDGGSFVASKPQLWSPQQIADTGVLPNFELAPAGGRIAAFLPAGLPEEQQTQNHVTLMLHFAEEVRQRMRSAR
jgi:eukaryotic-like serine/threonine-protein kinase